MAKYIELIEKYRIDQDDVGYNPPSYRWVDNTGEIVRCGECRYRITAHGIYDGWVLCTKPSTERGNAMHRADWFCADGEVEVQDGQ